MHPSSSYRALAGLAGALIPLAARWSPRLSQGHVGRGRSLAGFLEWARSGRHPSRPLIWWHAPSVGEGRQAEAVLVRVRERRPAWQFAFTHFSPSAEPLAASLPVDVAGYLPWDTPGPVGQLVAALQPTALVFAKLDLWPELTGQAAASGAAVAMVAATVSRRSGRTRWPARQLTRSGYATVTAAGAIAAEDAERLARLGIPPDRIQVTGDPRADSVADWVTRVDRGDPLLALGSPETLVAGSTWPKDEEVLLGALARLRATGDSGARLILAPHQPSPDHLGRVEAQARRAGLTIRRLGAMNPGAPEPLGDSWPDVILVDRLGILATLYGAGGLAYVGGGFGRAGLHSVLEPAGWSRPVLFGPRWEGSRDAKSLLGAGGGRALTTIGEAVGQLAEAWLEWTSAAGPAAGRVARQVVEVDIGSAERNAELVIELVERKPRRASDYLGGG